MSRTSKKTQLGTIMFLLAVASLSRYISDLKENKNAFTSTETNIVQNNSTTNHYEKIYSILTNVPEEPWLQQDQWNNGMIEYYPKYEETNLYNLWQYQMPRLEFNEWEEMFLKGRTR